MIIYKVTNLLNGKVYVGKTEFSLNHRKARHLYAAKRKDGNMILHFAIRKYGEENFKWEIVDSCLFKESLNALEIYYIKKFHAKGANGYNRSEGGEGQTGYKHTKETKKRLSNFNMGKIYSDETKKKISIAMSGDKCYWYGKHMSEEIKKKMRGPRGHYRKQVNKLNKLSVPEEV